MERSWFSYRRKRELGKIRTVGSNDKGSIFYPCPRNFSEWKGVQASRHVNGHLSDPMRIGEDPYAQTVRWIITHKAPKKSVTGD